MAFLKLFIISTLISSIFSGVIEIAPFISDGIETSIHDFPFMISVQQSTLQLCAGSLISGKYAISAANCMSNRYVPQLVVEYGNTLITPGVRDGPNKVGVNQIIFHPGYNETTLDNDICIIELKAEVDLSGFFDPFAHLATPGSRFPSGTIATHAGWGYNSPNDTSHLLNRANLKVLSLAECTIAVGDLRQPTFENICTLDESVICSGDMGSPLVIRRTLVGIASTRNGPLCTPVPYEFPNVYVAVSFYIDWIESVTGIQFNVNTFLSSN